MLCHTSDIRLIQQHLLTFHVFVFGQAKQNSRMTIGFLVCMVKMLGSFLLCMCNFHLSTDEGSVPEIAQYDPYYLPLNVFTASKGSNFYILFAITAAVWRP